MFSAWLEFIFRRVAEGIAAVMAYGAKQREFQSSETVKRTLEKTYQVVSTASVDVLWQKIINLADVASWHPLITSTNVPNGLIPKPGLIYRVFTRWMPVPIKIFVENVLPGELLSVRILPVPGLEERVVYRIESTVWGTRVSYSVKLRGWLSPLVWSFMRPHAAQVAIALVKAAEQPSAPCQPAAQDLFAAFLMFGGGAILGQSLCPVVVSAWMG